jgi:hypothetical protein
MHQAVTLSRGNVFGKGHLQKSSSRISIIIIIIIFIIIIIISWRGVRLCPLATSAAIWPSVSAPDDDDDDDDEFGAVGEM